MLVYILVEGKKDSPRHFLRPQGKGNMGKDVSIKGGGGEEKKHHIPLYQCKRGKGKRGNKYWKEVTPFIPSL